MDIAKVRLAKERAATKALEVYISLLQEEFKDLTLEEVREAFHETGHVREAILVAGDVPALHVKAGWTFCAHPAVIANALAKAIEQIKA